MGEPDRFTRRHLPAVSLLFELASGIRQQLIPAVIALISASTGSFYGAALAIVFFVLSVSAAVIRYTSTRIRITDEALEVESGWIFHVHKTIPFENIQNIDLVQNLFHRFLSVAEVRVETASGRKPEAILKVLSLNDTAALRATIASKRATVVREPADSSSAAEEPNVVATSTDVANDAVSNRSAILTIPVARLALAGVVANQGWALLFVPIGLLWESRIFTEDNWTRNIYRLGGWVFQNSRQFHWIWLAIGIALLMLILLRVVSVIWYVVRFYGYRLEANGEELRVSGGLFTKVTATVKRDRVQLISVRRTLLGRMIGLASIRLEAAGGGAEGEDAAATVARRWFVPVLHKSELTPVLEAIRPGLEWNNPAWHWQSPSPLAEKRLRRKWSFIAACWLVAAMIWQSWLLAAIAPICLAFGWWIARRAVRALRYTRTQDGVIYRSGFWTRKVSVSFFDKIQSVKLNVSPFDLRWKMATLSVDTIAAGPAEHRIEVAMLDATFAATERDAIVASLV